MEDLHKPDADHACDAGVGTCSAAAGSDCRLGGLGHLGSQGLAPTTTDRCGNKLWLVLAIKREGLKSGPAQ